MASRSVELIGTSQGAHPPYHHERATNMSMSRAMIVSGTADLGVGLMIVFITESPAWSFAGAVIGALGALSLGLGFILGELRDPVGREVGRWEREWSAVYSPVCRIHGSQICVIKSPDCPEIREKTGP